MTVRCLVMGFVLVSGCVQEPPDSSDDSDESGFDPTTPTGSCELRGCQVTTDAETALVPLQYEQIGGPFVQYALTSNPASAFSEWIDLGPEDFIPAELGHNHVKVVVPLGRSYVKLRQRDSMNQNAAWYDCKDLHPGVARDECPVLQDAVPGYDAETMVVVDRDDTR